MSKRKIGALFAGLKDKQAVSTIPWELHSPIEPFSVRPPARYPWRQSGVSRSVLFPAKFLSNWARVYCRYKHRVSTSPVALLTACTK
jgi:hypothetical protein